MHEDNEKEGSLQYTYLEEEMRGIFAGICKVVILRAPLLLTRFVYPLIFSGCNCTSCSAADSEGKHVTSYL